MFVPKLVDVEENYHFFWSGPFSQWHRTPFTIDGIKYNCAEQYMMAEKARLFEDSKTLKKILSTNSPKEQKSLGREVKNFNVQKWESKAKEIVLNGNLAKFRQDKKLRQLLLDTGDSILVEASPYDKIWGIGLTEDDKRAKSKSTWQGKNWLGYILTEVKQILKNDKKT